jgi:folate-dependent phosphoribosylglycinamide formyltransferase PurN
VNPILVIARHDSTYARETVARLCAAGAPPTLVLLGSRVERWLARLDSLVRLRRRLGWREALLRLRRNRGTKADGPPSRASLAELAHAYGFRLRLYDRANAGEIVVSLIEAGAPVVVLAGTGVVGRSVLQAAGGRCVNCHPALLPGLRGVDVIEWALARGQPLGVTVHIAGPSVDAGPILLRRTVAIESGETFARFIARYEQVQAHALADGAIALANGDASPEPHALDESELVFAAPNRIHRRARAEHGRRAAASDDRASVSFSLLI